MKQALSTAEMIELRVRSTGSGVGCERLSAEIIGRNPLAALTALAPAG